ncbi:uncharacterized protein LOC143501972 [Brachyhypopomus gauderio]|uniref:uncharacterized protein LOC143501972 n=1 Tax=Brachyhypopomus gauderio TaxID=698409 RepID=UPI0040423D6F
MCVVLSEHQVQRHRVHLKRVSSSTFHPTSAILKGVKPGPVDAMVVLKPKPGATTASGVSTLFKGYSGELPHRATLNPGPVYAGKKADSLPLICTMNISPDKPLVDSIFGKTNMLSLSGGHTIKRTIWWISSKVFTPNLAKSLNWCGRGHKRVLKQTACGQLAIAAAVKNPALPAPMKSEAEKCLKDYLHLAPARRSSLIC